MGRYDLLLIWYVYLDPELFVSGISFDDEKHEKHGKHEDLQTTSEIRGNRMRNIIIYIVIIVIYNIIYECNVSLSTCF